MTIADKLDPSSDPTDYDFVVAEVSTPQHTSTSWTLIDPDRNLKAQWTVVLQYDGKYRVLHAHTEIDSFENLQDAQACLIETYNHRNRH